MRQARPSAKPTRWIPSSSHPGISCAIAVRTTPGRWSTNARQLLGRGGIDQYIGGIEHAILHLLYARFFTRAMRDCRPVRRAVSGEPFSQSAHPGHGRRPTFYREDSHGKKQWINPAEVDVVHDERGRIRRCESARRRPAGGHRRHREDVEVEEQRRRSAVADRPVRCRHRASLHHVRRVRPTSQLEWSDAGVEGAFRFLKRLWRIVHQHVSTGIVAPYVEGELSAALKELRRHLHQTIVKVADDYGRRKQFNTAIAAVMELLNAYTRIDDRSAAARAVRQEVLEAVTLLLNPIVPHVCEALHAALRPGCPASSQAFPKPDASALMQDEIELVLQINGKLRGSLRVAAGADRATIEAAALACEAACRQLAGAAPRKVVVVPGRLVNIVV
jgi:leucyl-tRNA synthetase